MKCKQNVIWIGLGKSVAGMKTDFLCLIRRLIRSEGHLHKICRINGQIEIFAVKIMNDQESKKILINARKLKGIYGCKSIFIQKNVTFK